MVSRIAVLLFFLTLCFSQLVFARDVAPLFSGQDLNTGEEISLEDYRGKVVLLDFWASWCPPCLASLPAYDQLRTELGTGDFDVIPVNVDAKIQDAVDFLEERPVSFPVIFDPKGDIGIPYKIRTLPRAFLLDQEGKIVTAFNSYDEDEKEKLRTMIFELIEASQ